MAGAIGSTRTETAGRFADVTRVGDDGSPRLAAQRRKIDGLLGGARVAAQRRKVAGLAGAASIEPGTASPADADIASRTLGGKLRAVEAFGAKRARLQVRGNQYRVIGLLNPWLKIVEGVIRGVEKAWNKKGLTKEWIWRSVDTLRSEGLDPQEMSAATHRVVSW